MTWWAVRMPSTMKDPDLAALERLSTRPLAEAFADVARTAADRDRQSAAVERLTDMIAQSMTLADLLGRVRLLKEAGMAGAYADTPSPLVPRVTFRSAIRDILKRFPVLERSAERISEMYRTKHAFGLARAAAKNVTERVQKFMGDAIAAGKPVPETVDVLAATEGFTTAYAETVYRTNLSVAYTAGRMEQVRDPGLRRSFPAYEVIGPEADDPDTRQGRKEDRGENHAAAVGLVAGVDDPIWRTHTPPYGYSCRHKVRLVSRQELKERGLLRADGSVLQFSPPGLDRFAAHPRFTSSPLQRIYGQG